MGAGPERQDYRALFLQPTPMIDLRAPLEFARGAFPAAINLPLMSDDERAQVGTCYKRQGQQAAIALGHALVAGDVRAQRLEQWLDFARRYPAGCLYCWRGGLRSAVVQAWLQDEGITYPRVVGGYKAMRRFLLTELEHSLAQGNFVLVSGPTGSGKTRVIERLRRAVDLEGLANHRGSTFGQLPTPQPSQIDFENSLSIELLRLMAVSAAPVFLEDEGRLVGRLYLPESLRTVMAQAPMVTVEAAFEQRVEVVLEDYVLDLGRRYLLRYAEDGRQLHRDKLLADLQRIGKRLGGARLAEVAAMLKRAFDHQWRSGDIAEHRNWIAFLLQHYYDPMYQYQLGLRSGERLFSGDQAAVIAWAREHSADVGGH